MPRWIIAMFLAGVVLIARDMAKIFRENKRSRREAAVYDRHPQKIQMQQYADSFLALSERFYEMPYREEVLDAKAVAYLLERQRQVVCQNCAKKEWCWEQYQNLTKEQCREVLAAFSSEDEEQIVLAKTRWNSHCLYGSRFLEVLGNGYREDRQNVVWFNRVAESRRAVAEQLQEVAGILHRAADDIYSLNSLPDELAEKVIRRLKKQKVEVEKIWMQERPKEHLQIFITMRAGGNCRMTLRQAAEILSELCGMPMTAVRDSSLVLNGEFQTVLFREAVQYQVLYGVGRITKEQESISGDNYSALSENGQFVLCLSDGMGSGMEANKESETVVELFEQFLKTGFPREAAARMINSLLLLQGNDGMFSTFDLCSVDLYSGVCSFLKGGAAPTFIRRDTWVEAVTSQSLAAGLVQQSDFDTAVKKLYDGDYLVMMTDGVLDALEAGLQEEEKEEQMKQLLLQVHADEPREFARELLEKVLQMGNYRARDDMTVLAARIWKR